LTPTATTAPPTPSPVPQPPTATATAFTLEGFQTQYGDMLKDFETYNIRENTIREVYKIELLRKKLLEEIAKDTPRTEEQVLARHILVEMRNSKNCHQSSQPAKKILRVA
jgi:hypothetical protein